MKQFLFTLLALVMFAAPAAAGSGEKKAEATTEAATEVAAALEIGKPAPDFTLADTKGTEHKLADLKGKTVVLEWTNHKCPYVEKHYKSGNMQKLQKEAAASGVVWLTINSSAEGKEGYTSAEEANAIMEAAESAEAARLIDASGAVGTAYGAKTTPHMFVVDKEGTLVYMGAIDDQPSADAASLEGAHNYVKAALAEIAEGKPVTTASTKPYGCSVKYSSGT